jgi:hypothetical protein
LVGDFGGALAGVFVGDGAGAGWGAAGGKLPVRGALGVGPGMGRGGGVPGMFAVRPAGMFVGGCAMPGNITPPPNCAGGGAP